MFFLVLKRTKGENRIEMGSDPNPPLAPFRDDWPGVPDSAEEEATPPTWLETETVPAPDQPREPVEGPALNWLFVDLNSYFASVEQEVRPELRGRPVGIVPMMADTTV